MVSARLRRIWSLDWIPILFAQGFGLLCGLAGIYFTSRLVSPEVYGNYGLLLALVPVGGTITHYGISRHAARHWPVKDHARGREYARAAGRAGLVPSLSLLPLLGIAWWLVPSLGALPFAATLPWLWLAALAGAWAAVLHTILQAERAYRHDATFSCLNSLARTGGPLLAVLLVGASTSSLLIGFAVTHLVWLGLASWVGLRYLRAYAPNTPAAPNRPDATANWSFAGYHRAFWIAGLCTVINAGLPRWLAATCLDEHATGAFVLAGNLAIVLPNVLSAALGQFLLPRLRMMGSRNLAPTRRVLRQVEAASLVFGVVALGAVALLHVAMPLLAGRVFDLRYADAARYVFANGAFGVALALAHLYQFPALIADRPGYAAAMPGALTIIGLSGGLFAARLSPEMLLRWLAWTPLIAATAFAVLARRIPASTASAGGNRHD